LQPRIDAVALVSGAGRLDLPGFVEQMSTAAAWKLAARVPAAMTLAYSALSRLARLSPGAARKVLFSGIPKTDRAVIDRPTVGRRLVSAYVEATQAGGRGLTEDMQALLSPWDFDPTEIDLPVHLIHNREDTIAPPAHAEHWIETLRATRAVWLENAGHFLIEDHVVEILDLLGT
jgi:pimeloyl-ACP methyl ester carboxylesterase